MKDDADFSSITVLVVDDETFSLQFVSRVLRSLNVGAVLEASNGDDAIQCLKNYEPNVDLVITDIEMPEMDGFRLARHIRYGAAPKYKDVPILMLTGQDTAENIAKGRVHKIDGFIVKPAKPKSLESYIRKVLGL